MTPRNIGRYLLCDEIASGGMATVHLGRVVGPAGFSRTVAIKKMHPHFAHEPEAAAMFLDEARLAARIHHPNVVATLDVVARAGELFIVMEYVEGETLARLARAALAGGERVPQRITLSVLAGALSGLHAAHEATGERREPLSIVHRDVSPQNILVGVDGVPRVLDFGIAKAAARLESTRGGRVKGKLRYLSPEQIRQEGLDRRTDVYAAGVVLWEVLCGQRLFSGEDAGSIMHAILASEVPPPSARAPEVSPELDAIVRKALARNRDERFETALEMAEAIERSASVATPREVGAWVEAQARESLTERSNRILELESSSSLDGEAEPPLDMPPKRKTKADDPTALEATPAPKPTPSKARSALPFVLLLLVAGAIVLFVVLRPGALPARPSADAPAPVESRAPEPVISEEPTPRPVASEAPRPVVSRPSMKLPTKPKPKPNANCVPPYVIEADGTKRYKSECL